MIHEFTFTAAGGFAAANLDEALGLSSDVGWDDAMRQVGFYCSQAVGNEYGIHYALYERNLGGKLDWLVEFATASHSCDVHVSTWPDLIVLLSQLSGIVLAARDLEEIMKEQVDRLIPAGRRG